MDSALMMFCPYPSIDNMGQYDGISMKQPRYCLEKCAKECCSFALREDETISYYTCDHGFSVVVFSVKNQLFRINGVIETATNTASPRFKKDNRDKKFKAPEFISWLQAYNSVLPIYTQSIERQALESIHALHDIKSLIGSILTTAEEWVFDRPGQSIDDKINGAPEQLQTIYHSCGVVQSLLQITDVLVNPEVVKYGKPYDRSVHGIFYKLIKVHEKKAAKSGISFKLSNSNNLVRIYNSFLLIPQILIDNGIKYAERDSEIRIKLRDKENGDIHVDFSTYGTLVPTEDRNKIFKRSVRGQNAKTKGSGLGLYIAQLVANANGFEIAYEAVPHGVYGDRGFNHFKFRIPRSAPE